MLKVTKIFRFEMAHAIHGYSGSCKNIHGHSYELHVTVSGTSYHKDYITPPGFIMDFKEIKKMVTAAVIEVLDHKVVLSEDFLQEHPYFLQQENLITWKAEPTAENILLYIKQSLSKVFPPSVTLVYLKLYETKDSYAEWIPGNTFKQF